MKPAGPPSSGADGRHESDLALATRLATNTDSALGFGEDGGLVWRGVPEIHRMPETLAADPRLANRARHRMDEAYTAARVLSRSRIDAVHALAHVRVSRRILDGREAEVIVRQSLRHWGDSQ
jgi:hypothetical protein